MERHRILSCLVVIALLSVLGSGSVGALTPVDPQAPPAPPTALVQVFLKAHEDLARFEATGLPAYDRLQAGAGGYLLAGADPAGQAALAAAGLSFRVLDADLQGASYFVAYPAPSRDVPHWSDYGRLLFEPADGQGVLLRLSPDRVDDLLLAGVELRAITLQPKPLRPAVARGAIPAVIEPDPLIQTMIDQVTTAQIYTYTRQLAGELPVWVDGGWYTISTRHTYSGVPIQKTTRYMGQKMADVGLDVEYHVWNAATNPNVIGERLGSVNPDDIYIIGGHLDDVTGTPGADDNASASVATLLAAEILTQYNWGCTLRFALWTGEEQGLLGSEAYAQRAYNDGENILGYLNLDMIAYNTIGSAKGMDAIYNPNMPETQALAQLWADVIDAYNLDLVPQLVTSLSGGSDHYSFWQFGYNSILAIEDQSDFNPEYHGPGDTPDNNDPAFYTDMVKASLATLAHMSGCLIPSGIGSLDGHVTASDNGAPLPDVTITAENAGGYRFSTTTDETGYYTRTLMSGTYTVTAEGPQHSPATFSNVVITTDTVTTVDFQLDPKGKLYGYVTDATSGAPVAATVSAAGWPQTDASPTTGYYELYLNPGTWDVTAAATNYAEQTVTVSLVAGQELQQDFELLADVALVPDPIHAYVALGQGGTVPGQLINNMAAPYPFAFKEREYSTVEDVLVVRKDSSAATAMETALTSLGYSFLGVTDGEFQVMTVPDLLPFQAVFYAGTTGSSGAPSASETLLMAYLDAGGSLYISDNDLGYYRSGSTFYNTYLQSSYGGDDGGNTLTGEGMMSGLTLNVASDPYPDYFSVGTQGTRIFKWSSSNYAGGVLVQRNGYRAIHTGVDFQYIATAGSQLQVIDRIMGLFATTDIPWFGTSITAGTVPANDSLDWTNVFSATPEAGITAPGDYYARLLVNPGTLGQPRKLVPVIMTVLYCVPLTDLTVSVVTPAPISPGELVEFSVDLLPDGATTPYTYTVDASPEVTTTLDPFTFTLSFTEEGTHTVSVEAWNCPDADPVTDSVDVLVGEKLRVFLPVVVK